MQLVSDSFADGTMMPVDCAFGLFAADGTIQFCRNLNPQLTWRDLPRATRSLVLINDDLDVPLDISAFNRAGTVISRCQKRRSLCHWVLIDLAPDDDPIRLGEFSEGVSIGGKPGPTGPRGTRQGLNDYTAWFQNNTEMTGKYFGYDGPCPPYNDEIEHRYVFTLYALDVVRLDVDDIFNKYDVLRAMAGHIVSAVSLTGVFTSNRNLRTEGS